MKKGKVSLQHPEMIRAMDPSDGEYFGCDQNWFSSDWQQQAGCGPSTAATLLLYLHKTRQMPLPVEVYAKKDCLLLMEEVWSHVTPTPDGIYLIEQFCSGIASFADGHGLRLQCHSLDIPDNDGLRPGLEAVVQFIVQGLENDSPIAFLNLSNGEVADLEEWHWVTMVSLEADEASQTVQAEIFDGDTAKVIDFKLWYQTTVEGGALIYLLPDLSPV